MIGFDTVAAALILTAFLTIAAGAWLETSREARLHREAMGDLHHAVVAERDELTKALRDRTQERSAAHDRANALEVERVEWQNERRRLVAEITRLRGLHDRLLGHARGAADALVTLDSGKCVVSWPTSVIVYDSEQAARAVHITHMGGRGEEATFWPEWSSRPDFMRGVENAHLDANENAPWAVLIGGRGPSAKLRCPDWDTLTDRQAFADGYMAAASYLFRPREDMTVETGSES